MTSRYDEYNRQGTIDTVTKNILDNVPYAKVFYGIINHYVKILSEMDPTHKTEEEYEYEYAKNINDIIPKIPIEFRKNAMENISIGTIVRIYDMFVKKAQPFTHVPTQNTNTTFSDDGTSSIRRRRRIDTESSVDNFYRPAKKVTLENLSTEDFRSVYETVLRTINIDKNLQYNETLLENIVSEMSWKMRYYIVTTYVLLNIFLWIFMMGFGPWLVYFTLYKDGREYFLRLIDIHNNNPIAAALFILSIRVGGVSPGTNVPLSGLDAVLFNIYNFYIPENLQFMKIPTDGISSYASMGTSTLLRLAVGQINKYTYGMFKTSHLLTTIIAIQFFMLYLRLI
jgi:hypothetical protein